MPNGGALLAQHPREPPTHPWPLEARLPNVLCISLASFKFYPYSLLISTFYHLNYTDDIMQTLAPPLVCLHLATHCTLLHFTFLSTSTEDLMMDMDKAPTSSTAKSPSVLDPSDHFIRLWSQEKYIPEFFCVSSFLHLDHPKWRGSACCFWQPQDLSIFQLCVQRLCVPPRYKVYTAASVPLAWSLQWRGLSCQSLEPLAPLNPPTGS